MSHSTFVIYNTANMVSEIINVPGSVYSMLFSLLVNIWFLLSLNIVSLSIKTLLLVKSISFTFSSCKKTGAFACVCLSLYQSVGL